VRFERHAPAQEQILTAFEEEGWEVRIDDPLPPNGHTDPKVGLNRSIHRLNRRLLSAPIHFSSDGRGEGTCWHENGNIDCVYDVI
jgi:hypothetical protein